MSLDVYNINVGTQICRLHIYGFDLTLIEYFYLTVEHFG